MVISKELNTFTSTLGEAYKLSFDIPSYSPAQSTLLKTNISLLYIRPQAFKCQPGLQKSTYNLCRFATTPLQPLPFFEAELWGTAELLVPLLFPACSVEQSSPTQHEPMEDFTLVTEQPSPETARLLQLEWIQRMRNWDNRGSRVPVTEHDLLKASCYPSSSAKWFWNFYSD